MGDVKYIVTLNEKSLTTELQVLNPSGAKEDMKMKALFHNYLAVSDVKGITIEGFKAGTKYRDNKDGGKMKEFAGGDAKLDRVTGM